MTAVNIVVMEITPHQWEYNQMRNKMNETRTCRDCDYFNYKDTVCFCQKDSKNFTIMVKSYLDELGQQMFNLDKVFTYAGSRCTYYIKTKK